MSKMSQHAQEVAERNFYATTPDYTDYPASHPVLTLPAVRARLLPLAQAAGFARLQLQHTQDERPRFEAYGHGGTQPFTALTPVYACRTLAELEAAATASLLVLTENLYASI